jgi:hypothetical protein
MLAFRKVAVGVDGHEQRLDLRPGFRELGVHDQAAENEKLAFICLGRLPELGERHVAHALVHELAVQHGRTGGERKNGNTHGQHVLHD